MCRRVAIGGREIAPHLVDAQSADGDLRHVVGAQAGPGGPAQVGDALRVISHHQSADGVHGHSILPGQDQPQRRVGQSPADRAIGHAPQSIQDDEVERTGQVQVHDVPPEVVRAVRECALERL